MATDTKLCNLDQIEDGGSEGFIINTVDGRCGLMVIRVGKGALSYINSCPHIGTPLEIRPGRFLDQTGEYILCSTHGALFQIHNGLCIAGPCVNKRLTPVNATVRDGAIFIDKNNLPTLWPPDPKETG